MEKGWYWNILVRNGQKQFEEHYIDGKKEVFLPHGLRMVTSFTKKISKTINAMVLGKSGMIMDRKN